MKVVNEEIYISTENKDFMVAVSPIHSLMTIINNLGGLYDIIFSNKYCSATNSSSIELLEFH
jgi:hypothetical protein